MGDEDNELMREGEQDALETINATTEENDLAEARQAFLVHDVDGISATQQIDL